MSAIRIVIVVIEFDETGIKFEKIERFICFRLGNADECLTAIKRSAAAKPAKPLECNVAHERKRARVDSVIAQELDGKRIGQIGLHEDCYELAFDALGGIDEVAHPV
jgi:hypothetical protein